MLTNLAIIFIHEIYVITSPHINKQGVGKSMNIKLNNVNILEKQESFGRKNKKAEEKHSYTTQPKTSTSHKVRNSLVGAGLALASLVGMSSCSETNQIVDINLDKLFEYIDSINDRLD